MKRNRPGTFGKTKHIHFVGIGGIGMSGLATIMKNLSFKVTGSDLQPSEITQNLKKMGIRVSYGHRRDNVKGADVVVYSSAIKRDNPEIVGTGQSGVPVIHRAELLAELTRTKFALCISGTHGKTTTTSLVSEVLQHSGLSPTTVIGGIVIGKSQATLGAGDYLVCEVDESDKSFLRVYPSYAVVTNIEAEHLDYYTNLDEIMEHFGHYANHVPFWGRVFLGADSETAMAIRKNIRRRVILYGLDDCSDLRAEGLQKYDFGVSFIVKLKNRRVGKFTVNLPGRHNVANALAAIGVGLELDIRVNDIKDALRSFKGVHRRIEYIGDVNGVKIFDDYGHHPTEIAVTLQTLRDYFPSSRIVSVFQPHRYTRTFHLFDQFAKCFLTADVAILTEIYGAHESPIPGITGRALAKRVSREQEGVHFLSSFKKIIEFLADEARPGDVIIFQGAGDINKVARILLAELR
ncbi:MAG: UDP-N-acetylmuramate--L-alanine ligase [candidate division WOR-3 bacterium]|nr:MAG: UDP-N-acetylmuramate--L-alanine ligase [candidate division WOR-3 bacterium]